MVCTVVRFLCCVLAGVGGGHLWYDRYSVQYINLGAEREILTGGPAGLAAPAVSSHVC